MFLIVGAAKAADQWEYLQMSLNQKTGAKVFPDGIYFSINGSYRNKGVLVGIIFDLKYKATKLRKEAFEERWKKIFDEEYSTEHMETVGIIVIDFANNLGIKGFELVGIENFKDKVDKGEVWTFKRKLN